MFKKSEDKFMKRCYLKSITVLCAALCLFCFSGCDFLFHTHSYTEKMIKPTCESKGYTLFSCSCGDYYTENEVPALGHKLVDDEAVEATCTQAGLTAGKHCSVCNKAVDAQKVIPPLAHIDEEHDGICDVCQTHFENIKDIGNVEELKAINGDLDGSYRLVSNISLTNEDWIALGSSSKPFNGALYGMGHIISGLSISNVSVGGLFAYNSGVIDGVVLKDVSFSLDNMSGTMGGITASNSGSITNCEIGGNITIKDNVSHYDKRNWPNYDGSKVEYTGIFGGICAENKGTVSDCLINATFNCEFGNTNEYDLSVAFPYLECGHSSAATSTVYFGGVCGKNSGDIKNCVMQGSNKNTLTLLAKYKNHGTSTARINAYIGSLAGVNDKNISDSSAVRSEFIMNVGTTSLKEASGGTYGIVCELNLYEDSVFTGIIGKNNGQATDILYS